MTYRIDLSSVAKAEADAAFLILSQYKVRHIFKKSV